jgi:hypothetical protein
MAEPQDAELLDQLREGAGTGTQVSVDRAPDMVVDGLHDLLWAPGLIDPFPVGKVRQHACLQAAALQLGEVRTPGDLDLR